MGKLRFLFDQKNCIGCRACQVACKDKNNLPLGSFIRYVVEQEDGQRQQVTVRFFSYAYPFQQNSMAVSMDHLERCNTCPDLRKNQLNPACVDACVTKCLTIKEGDR